MLIPMPPVLDNALLGCQTLSEKKRNLVQELNAYIAQKKSITAQMQAKSMTDSVMGGKKGQGVECT